MTRAEARAPVRHLKNHDPRTALTPAPRPDPRHSKPTPLRIAIRLDAGVEWDHELAGESLPILDTILRPVPSLKIYDTFMR